MTTKRTRISARAERLSYEERHRQLLQLARRLVGEEGTDRLTLTRLAERAGVSKPVAYDHFGRRIDLLLELYRWIDVEKIDAFREHMKSGKMGRRETIGELARAYIDCASDVTSEFQVIGAALAGTPEKASVFADLLENSIRMFIAVLRPHVVLAPSELERRCRAFVAAGECLAAEVVIGRSTSADATATLAAIIAGGTGLEQVSFSDAPKLRKERDESPQI
ncbi:TetR family transcriptional regulator [Rhodopseudomonas thermotolerans]|uniref:TetR family transcriptional regulator n=2 Tax=Rhodopseudomonas TaxID=1073 RepID=A0A336JYB6_9BRAD|nr:MULTISPECIES: TetR/AcrR family transcriptional regulator [Rhodopseudomonas]RED21376.1 TetR family transcriptional regulator [Rhodopseudomonas pentothenatexigens]REF86865.1 TetR family transcriptional regulator [Rhodopseudomonas thermotolerans]SSW93713.1 TetR family transcriptional regulator [Rhodopseudomonas pentothenatexigens]